MDRIGFNINGINYSVGQEVSSDVTLLDYIRNVLELRGTKYMCRQAGCGACIVAMKTPGAPLQAVNSCMVSITSCQDWEIQTIEDLGNRQKGYHVIQKTLASYNGSQCGYCSPGWVMSMYCLLREKKEPTMLEIEKSFGSNICRCTGYRPILEAFKTFAKDCPKTNNVPDIEDLKCDKTGKRCESTCSGNHSLSCNKFTFVDTMESFSKITLNEDSNSIGDEKDNDDEDWCIIKKNEFTAPQMKLLALKDGRKWFRVNNISDILQIFQKEGTDSYMLVGGNTAKGAYPILEYPRILIDINAIADLKDIVLDQNLIIGSAVTLTELLNIYRNWSKRSNFEYLEEYYNHLQKVAHIAVRNIGTIAGNMMIKYKHNEFQSDLYLMFQTVGAELTICAKRKMPRNKEHGGYRKCQGALNNTTGNASKILLTKKFLLRGRTTKNYVLREKPYYDENLIS